MGASVVNADPDSAPSSTGLVAESPERSTVLELTGAKALRGLKTDSALGGSGRASGATGGGSIIDHKPPALRTE